MATTVTFKTEREFLTAIVKGDFGTEFTDFAKARIAALDKKNAQRKVSKSAMAHKAENDSFKSAILAALADGTTKKASDLATALNVSTQKISALAKQLADSGAITVSDVKVKGKGTVKGYTLVIAEDGEDGEDIAD
jgi:hypothetical protein